MKKPVSAYDNPEALRKLRQNALDLGETKVAHEALIRMSKLLADDQPDEIHYVYYQALAAYEQILREIKGPGSRASGTRRELANKPLNECLEGWAASNEPTRAFGPLVEYGLAHLTAESIVLQFPESFSEETLVKARKRLSKIGK